MSKFLQNFGPMISCKRPPLCRLQFLLPNFFSIFALLMEITPHFKYLSIFQTKFLNKNNFNTHLFLSPNVCSSPKHPLKNFLSFIFPSGMVPCDLLSPDVSPCDLPLLEMFPCNLPPLEMLPCDLPPVGNGPL